MKRPADYLQKGVAYLGLLVVLFLTVGLFTASKMASNPDLSFFNIGEKAAKPEEQASCTGCADSKYAWVWDKKTEQCKKRYVKTCTSDTDAATSGQQGISGSQQASGLQTCGAGGEDAKCFKKLSCGNLSEYSQKIERKCPTDDEICCKKK